MNLISFNENHERFMFMFMNKIPVTLKTCTIINSLNSLPLYSKGLNQITVITQNLNKGISVNNNPRGHWNLTGHKNSLQDEQDLIIRYKTVTEIEISGKGFNIPNKTEFFYKEAVIAK